MKNLSLLILTMLLPQVASADGVEKLGQRKNNLNLLHKQMKRVKLLSLLIMGCFSTLWANTNVDNQSLLVYKVINNKELSVSCNLKYVDKVEGTLVIPETAEVNGTTYPVTQIANRAFSGCRNMTELHIPKTINTINVYVLEYCEKLTRISVSESNPYLKSEDGVVFSKTGKTILLYPSAKEGSKYVIPEGVDTIGGAFSCIVNPLDIVIPKSTLVLRRDAFHSYNITSLTIKTIFPPTVDSQSLYYTPDISPILYVPTGALEFYQNADGWNKLKKMVEVDMDDYDDNPFEFTLEKNNIVSVKAKNSNVCGRIDIPSTTVIDGVVYPVTKIANAGFSLPKITEVTIPASVTLIGSYAFSSCTALKSVTACHYYPLELIDYYVYFGYDKSITLYVPIGAKEFYQNSDGWCMFSNIEEKEIAETNKEPFDYTVINDNEVSVKARHKRIMGKVTIPSQVEVDGKLYSVTQIANSGFRECKKIQEITIPPTLQIINSFAFWDCDQLESLIVDSENKWYMSIDGVLFTRTGKTLFRYPPAKSIEEYVVPETVDTIYTDAFYQNKFLKSVVIPKSVSTIQDYAFKECNSLKAMTLQMFYPPLSLLSYNVFGDIIYKMTFYIPNGSMNIYKNIDFWKTRNIQEVDMEGIDSNPPFEFNIINENSVSVKEKYQTFLGKVEIPDSVEIDGKTYAIIQIGWMTGVTEITIPAHISYIQYRALNRSNLKAIIIRQFYPLSISDDTFSNNTYRNATLYVPTGSKEIYQNADNWKKFEIIQEINMEGIDANPFVFTIESEKEVSLKAMNNQQTGIVEIPETVEIEGKEYNITKISSDAFFGCKKITQIIIPKTVNIIECSFYDCNKLESIIVDKDNKAYYSTDGVLFSSKKNELLIYPCGKTTEEYSIPDGVKAISMRALSGNKNIKMLTIPVSVSSIECSFSGCNNLENIFVDDNNEKYKSIDGVLFTTGLRSLLKYPIAKKDENYEIPNGVKSFGSEAFLGNKYLKSVVIPQSVTYFGNQTFYECTSLSSITLKQFYPITHGITFPFSNQTYKNATLYIPIGSITFYKEAEIWNEFNKIQETEMNDIDMEKLTFAIIKKQDRFSGSIIIGVTAQPKHNGVIGKIDIPETVELDGQTYTVYTMTGFSSCNKITEITIPKTIEEIDNFNGCSKLERINVNSDNVNYSSIDGVLFSSDGKTIHTFPAALKTEEYNIPEGVTEIDMWAFIDNPFIKTIIIPNSIRKISYGAFADCQNLSSIILKVPNANRFGNSSYYNDYMFSEEIYQNATLFVPKGRLPYYKESVIWGKFSHIEEMEMPDVEISSSPFASYRENQMILGYWSSDDFTSVFPLFFNNKIGGEYGGAYKYCIGFGKDITNALLGNKITHIRFALANTDITDMKIWIANSLTGKILYEQSIPSLKTGWNEVVLRNAFEIGNDSLFIGLAYQQDGKNYPICSKGPLTYEKNCSYACIPNKEGKCVWKESFYAVPMYFSEGVSSVPSIQCLIEGDNLPQYHLHITRLFPSNYDKYFKVGNEYLGTMYVSNFGKKAITDCKLKCYIDDTYAATIEGGTLSGCGSVESFTHACFSLSFKLPNQLSLGKKTLSFLVDSINGVAVTPTDFNKMPTEINIYSKNMGRQKTLVNHFTGAWCPYESDQIEKVESFVNDDNYILVSSHSGDQLSCGAGEVYFDSFCEVTPQFTYGRYYPDLYISKDNSYSEMGYKKLPSFANVIISASYFKKTRMLKIKVTGTKNEDFDALIENTNLTVLLTEDNVVSPQFSSNGYIQDYVHQGVLRTNVSAVWGDPVVWVGDQYEKNYTVKLDKDWVADNIKIVAFLGKPFTGNNYGDLHITNSNDLALKDIINNQPNDFIPGDANGDGIVDATDIVEVVKYIMGNPSEKFVETLVDVNGDGIVNAADIVWIANYIIGR